MLVPFEISTSLPFSLMVVAVALPERTWKVDALSGSETSCVLPDVKDPCQVVVPLTITETHAVAPLAPKVSLLPVVGRFLSVTACVAPLAAATEISSLPLFSFFCLDAFSDGLELLEADALLDFEDAFDDFDDFDDFALLRLDETATLSESAGIVCFGPDCDINITP